MTAGARLKVLVVDDSPLFRRALSRALDEMPEVELVGTANDGKEALDKIRGLHPDLVTLDLEMPGMDGIATLRALQQQGLRTRVVMLSAFGGERKTVEALCLGAEDFIIKPQGGALTALRSVLQQKLSQFCRPCASKVVRAAPVAPRRLAAAGARSNVSVVVIGVSTGGPNALAEVLRQFNRPLGVPTLIVQHMPAGFTRLLAERLNGKCLMPVQEAQHQQPLLAGNVYIAPGDYHLEVKGNSIKPTAFLQQGPTENGCRPAADVLFRSAASVFGNGCLAVVMTGMGKDGFLGCQQIVAAGGHVLAQDKETCVVWGMPRFVCESGIAEEVQLSQLGTRIQESVELGYLRK